MSDCREKALLLLFGGPRAQRALTRRWPCLCARRYQKAYNDYARAIHSQYPGCTFKGDIYHPGDLKMAAAQVLQLMFFGGLAFSLIGRTILPEPYAKFLENNQMAVLGCCFMGNVIAGNLLNTGAFEVRVACAASRAPASLCVCPYSPTTLLCVARGRRSNTMASSSGRSWRRASSRRWTSCGTHSRL